MTVMPCPQCGTYLSDNAYGTKCGCCGYVLSGNFQALNFENTHITFPPTETIVLTREQLQKIHEESKEIRKSHFSSNPRENSFNEIEKLRIEINTLKHRVKDLEEISNRSLEKK